MKFPLTSAEGVGGTLPPLRLWALAGVLLVLAACLVRWVGWDAAWLLWVHATPPSSFSEVAWSCLTVAGLGWSALILVLAADRGAGRLAALLVPVFLLGSLLTHLPKALIASPRPAATALLSHLHIIGATFTGSVSMPSGHALTAAATAALLYLAVPRGRGALTALLLGIALLIGLSRVVVGAHWPSDVLAGFGLGLVTVWACVRALLWSGPRRVYEKLARAMASRAGQHWLALAELGAAAGLLLQRTGYPAGVPMVVALGVVALVSAASRWWTLFETRPLQQLARPPVERT
jgi:membrane-associated phospholipid phosphatase